MARVDHYVGYPVEAVVQPNKGTNSEWTFGLVLEGGAVIRFYNVPVPKESEVAGAGKFIMAVTNYADGAVDVIVGKPADVPTQPPKEAAKLAVEQGSYSVIKPEEPDVEWFPLQASDLGLPEDPSGVRAVEAPEPQKGENGSEPISAVEEAENG